MNIRLSKEQKIKVLNSQDIFSVMQQILLRENKIRRNQEHFWVIGLNNTNKILFIELVSLGASNRIEVAPPEVFRIAIYKLASKIILVHNHPSGTTNISQADKDATDRMMKAGDMLKIEVLDHLVITEDACTSFLDTGLMDKLRKSGRYKLIDTEKADLSELKFEIERKRDLEIAARMKKKGIDADTIQWVTKLRKAEIKKLK